MDLEPLARKLAAAAGWRDAPQLLDALVASILSGAVSPGRRPFLQGPLPPPTLHPIAGGPIAQMGRKGFNPAKTNKLIQLPPKY